MRNLYEDLATKQAGLALNDELVAIDGQPLTGLPGCDAYWLVQNTMKKQDTILLQVKRGTEQKEFRLVKYSPF